MTRNPIKTTTPPGRNELCACGSGVKVKKCCGSEAKLAARRQAEYRLFEKMVAERKEARRKAQLKTSTASFEFSLPAMRKSMAPMAMMAAAMLSGIQHVDVEDKHKVIG